MLRVGTSIIPTLVRRKTGMLEIWLAAEFRACDPLWQGDRMLVRDGCLESTREF